MRFPHLTRAQWLWGGAGALLALFFVWMAWPRAQAVDFALIDRGLVVREIVDEGRTRIHDVFVVASPVGGALQRIELEPGDTVTRGQVIANVLPADPALLDARFAAEARAGIAAAHAGLQAAEAELDLARRDQGRVAHLAERGFASPAALESANAALRAARAHVAAGRADVARARAAAGAPGARAQGPTRVRSPANGRVLRLLQESAMVIGAGAPILEIGDPGQMEVVADFLSQDAAQIRAGARAAIENWGGDTALPARVTRIEPFARTRVSALGVEEQRVNVIVRLTDPAGAPPLGHGFRVDVRVVMSEQANALRAPTDALVRDGADWAVYRIVRGRARLTPVSLGDGGRALSRGARGFARGRSRHPFSRRCAARWRTRKPRDALSG